MWESVFAGVNSPFGKCLPVVSQLVSFDFDPKDS